MVEERETAAWEQALADVFAANGSEEWAKTAAKFEKTLPKGDKARREIAEDLCQRLKKEDTPARKRSRIISLLAHFEMPELCQQIVPFTNPEHEPSDRVQYWALSALAAMAPPDLEEILNKIIDNPNTNSRVTAVARRIQIQNSFIDAGKRNRYFEDLLVMSGDGNADNRWAVMSALINNGFLPQALPSELEHRSIVDLLGPALMDEGEWRDVRIQAARTLGTVRHHYAGAISALITTFRQTTSKDVRRRCLQSLAQIGAEPALQKREYKREQQDVLNFMLEALRDEDTVPDLRNRAIEALQQALSTEDALETVIDAILKHEEEDEVPQGYVEALRRIDRTLHNQKAVELLTQHLWHPDPKVQTRASATMELVGGEKAMRILIGQQRHFIDTYTQILDDADEQIMTQFDQLMGNARTGFRVSMIMHATVFSFGAILLVTTLWMAISSGEPRWLLGSLLGTLASILATYYDEPLRNIHESTLNLVKVNIAFLGYMRQINQIDATFKQLFLNSGVFDLEQMKATVGQIQTAVDESLEKVQSFTEWQADKDAD